MSHARRYPSAADQWIARGGVVAACAALLVACSSGEASSGASSGGSITGGSGTGGSGSGGAGTGGEGTGGSGTGGSGTGGSGTGGSGTGGAGTGGSGTGGAGPGGPFAGLKFYYGDNHFHTGYSDDNSADQPPVQGYANARQRAEQCGNSASWGGDTSADLGGYFLFTSDHIQYISTRPDDLTDDMYQQMRAQTDDAAAGLDGPDFTFTAFPGGELTGLRRDVTDFFGLPVYPAWDDKFGHLNLFNLASIAGFTEDDLTSNSYGTNRMDDLSTYKAYLPDGSGVDPALTAIGQFNHSGYNDEPRTGDDADHLYPYTADRAAVFRFFEITDGNRVNWSIGAAQYNICLRSGYHVSPVVGSDIHGTADALRFDTSVRDTVARTVIVAPPTINHSPQERRVALLGQAHRGMVYATEDSNLQVTFSINSVASGGTLPAAVRSFSVHITVDDPGSPGTINRGYDDKSLLQTVELVRDLDPGIPYKDVATESQMTQVLQSWTPGNVSSFSQDVVLRASDVPNPRYIYVRVTQQDGDRAMTTPVFFE